MRPGPPPSQNALQPWHREPAINATLPAAPDDLPPLPEPSSRWSADVRSRWLTYWAGPLRGMLIAADEPAIRRLFDLYQVYDLTMDAWFDAQGRYDEEAGEVRGVLHLGDVSAELKQLDLLAKQIDRLEERFGITPLVRAKLGIAVSDLKKAEAAREGAIPGPQRKRRD